MISVGIDVSKEKSTVCILKPNGEVLTPPYEMLHTAKDIGALADRLNAYDEEARVIMETTGHYHWPVVTLLSEKGIFVSCINSLRMWKYCSQSIRKGKTDRIDSIKIASYGLVYWHELIRYLPDKDTYSELRTYSRQYHQYTSLLIKAKVNLNNLLDQTMPGIQNLLANKNGYHKLSDFAEEYWHFEYITSKSETAFTVDYCKWGHAHGYRKNESKAKEIYALARNGVPVLACTEANKLLVTEAVRIMHEIQKSQESIITHMDKLASELPEYSIVFSMGGIGTTLAARIIAEIGDVRKFHSKGALIAYAGIDAPPYQSGAFNSTKRSISKRGNKYLRKVGYEVMQSVMRKKPTYDEAVYQFMLKKQAEGKSGKTAKIAGLNKFLKIYYARVNALYCETDEQLMMENEF